MSTSPLAQRVAADVRAELARQRRSVREMAISLDIPYYVLSRRMRGLVPFDVDELTRVADFLGVPVADLLARNDLASAGCGVNLDGETPLTMDIAAAAQRLGCGVEWLKQQARRGLVPHVLMGRQRRFTEAHLVAILDAREQVGADPWARSPRAQARRRRAS